MRTVIAVAVVFLLIGCGGGGAAVKKDPEVNDQAAMQAKFQASIARESKDLKPAQTTGDLKINVLSSGIPKATIVSAEKPLKYKIDIPIGASTDATCYLTETMASPAGVIKTIFDNISKLPNIQSSQFKTIDSDIFNNIGYLYLEVEYLTKDSAFGTAKLVAASSFNVSFYCIHDELGYKKTLLNVADSLANSAPVQNFIKDFGNYDKKQIDIVSMNKLTVGFAESYQFTMKDKTKKNLSFTTFLIPRSVKDLMTGDSVDTTTYNADSGAIVSGSYSSFENDEPEHEVELAKVATKKYKAQGEYKGKKFDETFGSERPLVSATFVLDQYIAGKAKKAEWSFDDYIAQSPLKPTKSKMVLKEKLPNGGKKIEHTFLTFKALYELDGKSYSTMNLDLGSISFLIQRKYFDAR